MTTPSPSTSISQRAEVGSTVTRVCMIVYTLYDTDARVRREAETLAATGRYEIHVLALKDQADPRQYPLDGVTIQQLDVAKYQGR